MIGVVFSFMAYLALLSPSIPFYQLCLLYPTTLFYFPLSGKSYSMQFHEISVLFIIFMRFNLLSNWENNAALSFLRFACILDN